MARYLGGLITKDESLVIPANNFQDTSAPGVWTLEEAQALNKQGLWPTAGVDNPDKFVENIFSCDTYTGNATARSITTGIDLANEGGLVWGKARTGAYNHWFYDTVRGAEKPLVSNTNGAEQSTSGAGLTAFNSDGFSLSASSYWNENQNNINEVAWTFRKAPKFFDVVTYTGDGSAGKTVSHSLGQVPGMILVKNLSQSDNWAVYHRGADSSAPEDKYLILNTNAAVADSADWWYDTAPTSSVFTVGTDHSVNANGENYVAYLFGHDTSSDGMIQCGSYDGTGSYTTDSGPLINLGFEPQWIMVKRINNVGNWHIFDTLRGITSKTNNSTFGTDAVLFADATTVEADYSGSYLKPHAIGFQMESSSVNSSGQKYIYMAIRKAPMQTPTSRSSVFAIDTRTGDDGVEPAFTSGFIVDAALYSITNLSYSRIIASRFQGNQQLDTSDNGVDSQFDGFEWDFPNGWHYLTSDNSNIYSWMFRRAPKFFDVVCYVGTGSAKTENHNLGVAPEMMWIKSRGNSYDWAVYYGDATDYLKLNTDAATADDNTYWNDTAPTSTVFTVGTQAAVNLDNSDFIAFLFATLAGISKVGTFSHTNGSSTDVDCGFSSGSSFVIAKRTDSTGDWYLWDSTRGIVSGNDPYVVLNSSAAQVTNTDYIDPLNSGFQIASGFTTGSYMFYAIAA